MTQSGLTSGTRLGHYTVVGRLGAGGMGEVYRARDEGLKRDVALKVLPQDTVADPSARARLLREARSAAALNHPHICTIHEVGEEQGRDFIAMELVEGRPLNEVAGVAGFAPDAIVHIAIEIADALAHAHERGVVHRDLKSANVMLTSDARVKVMDFGLARLVPTADSATVAGASLSLTEAGAIVGTTHYMSPEALSGADVDARGDIWALGVMLHEMAAGELPFDGHTRFQVAAAIMHSQPRPLPQTVPAGLRAVITRCLEKEPTRRYQRASEVRAALEAAGSASPTAMMPGLAPAPEAAPHYPAVRTSALPVAGIMLALLAVAGVVVFRDKLKHLIEGPTAPPPIRSLAVLPLENLSRDAAQGYFADGLTEAISGELAKISALRVIAQGSVAGLVRKRESLADIGRALSVPALLRGSVVTDSLRVRISIQLVRAQTGELLWAEHYDRNQRDVLSLQSEVALAVAKQIQVALTPAEKTRLAVAAPVDPEAYRFYLKGREDLNKGAILGAEQSAERQFRHAIELAPEYAPAWTGLADAAYAMSSIFLPPNIAIPKSRAAAEKALALDPSLAEAHTSYGVVKMVYDWDWAGAEREFDRAIALQPGNAMAHSWRGRLLVQQGRFDEGIAAGRRALDLDPLSLGAWPSLGWQLYFARRYDAAIKQLQAEVISNPDEHGGYVGLGLALLQKGDPAGGIASIERGVAMYAESEDLWQLAYAYGMAGRRKDAERVIAQLMERRKQGFVAANSFAASYGGLGDKDEAFRWLDIAIKEHSEPLIWLRVDPAWDPLRSDPRFARILRRVNLAPHGP